MLVLTRKKGESILIGEDIEIVIAEIGANQVRIGVKAPRHTQIFRKEIYDSIGAELRSAAQMSVNLRSRREDLRELFRDK